MTFAIGPQDQGRKRPIENNGIKYTLEAHDPYGFVTVYCHKTNSNLASHYTGFREAENAAITHSLTLKKKEA